MSPSTVCELNQKIYAQIEKWRQRQIEKRFVYVYLDGVWLKRSRGGEVRNVSVLVAIGVDEEGFRHVLGVSEGTKEDGASWTAFLWELKQRGLAGVQLFVSDKCLGLIENLAEFYPGGALSALRGPPLLKRVDERSERQGERRCGDAEGDSRARGPGCSTREGSPGDGEAACDEA